MKPDSYRIKRLYFIWAQSVEDYGPEIACAMTVDDKVFIPIDHGVKVVPKDGSYQRFIADSWYSDIDVQNL